MAQISVKASVIVPFTRRSFILRIINSLISESKNLEIIIVGKGSAFAKKYNSKVQAIEPKNLLNPSQARNLGAKAAKGDFLVFIDDDCIPQKDWLKENIKALKNSSIGAVGGKVVGGSNKYFARALDFSNFTFVQNTKQKEMPLCAASFGMRKDIFKNIGGFNEEMLIGEDTDLSMRLKSKGFKTIYNPNIKVLHMHKRENFKDLIKYQFNNGKIKGLVIEKKYPLGFWFSFLDKISKPYFYIFFILPFSVIAVFASVLVNFKNNPGVLFYIPGIFLGKFSCQCGIFVWTLKRPKTFA